MKKIKSFEELNWFRKKSEESNIDVESDKNVRSAFESIKSTFKPEKLTLKSNADTDDEEWFKEFAYKITESYNFVLSKMSNFDLFSFRNANKIKYTVKIGSKTVECSDTLCEEMFKFFKDEYNKKNKKI